MRTTACILAVTLLLGGTALAVDEADELMSGTSTVIKTAKLAKFAAKPSAGDLPDAANDPTAAGASLRIFDTGTANNDDTYALPAAGWSRIPGKTTKPLKGFKYKGAGSATDPCKSVLVKATSVKANCKGSGVTLNTPFAANVGIILTVGPDSKRYCASFGGTGKNDEKQVNRKGAGAPSVCPSPFVPTTTTVATPSTSTSLLATTSTSSTSTSSTSIPVPTTTSTSVTSTTVDPNASTTSSTSSTTSSTVAGLCCNDADFVSFSTVDASGDCGDIVTGTTSTNLACAGLYTGGGGNSVPLPLTVPDLGQAVSAITACTGQSATLGATTSAQTGSNRNCTDVGCLFGAPLAVPNPDTPPTSVCVLNFASAGLTGTAVCNTGATSVILPLNSVLYLTGDTATDPTASITGVQPCPLCTGGDPMTPGSGTCVGGTNAMGACTPGTTTLGGDPSYPTSHDCPPDPAFDIGTLPIAFSLTTGTVTWNAVTSGTQLRVFSGFCRDADDTGGFEDPANHCLENGMAVGAGCTGTFEACEQRTQGAFGPNGNGVRTITAIGTASSILGGPAAGTLVSVFSIPPTFNSTVDAAGDLPGPGAVALPGEAELCPTANPCPVP